VLAAPRCGLAAVQRRFCTFEPSKKQRRRTPCFTVKQIEALRFLETALKRVPDANGLYLRSSQVRKQNISRRETKVKQVKLKVDHTWFISRNDPQGKAPCEICTAKRSVCQKTPSPSKCLIDAFKPEPEGSPTLEEAPQHFGRSPTNGLK